MCQRLGIIEVRVSHVEDTLVIAIIEVSSTKGDMEYSYQRVLVL